MLAMVFDGEAVLKDDVPKPAPGSDEALLAVRLAGVCRTDLEILKGYMNFRGVMGHEFVADVVDGPDKWKHKRVVAEINCPCGRCDLCKAGLGNHCFDRTVLGIAGRDGCFAEFIAVPVANLHEVPPGVSDEEAVFIEPLAAAFQIVRQVPVSSDQKVIVFGAGRLGQLVARVLKSRSGSLLLVGRHAGKLEAAEKQGIQTVPADDFKPDRRADIVVDATGEASGFQTAMQTVRPRGIIVLKSTFTASGGMNLSPLVVDEITVIGSRCGPFDMAIKAFQSREIDVSALIGERYLLRRAGEALEAASAPESIKVLIDVQG